MKKTIVFILTLILLLPAIVIGYGVSLPEYYGDTYYAELSELYQKLKDTQGKKIVIVGGSNVTFGVDSAQMEATLRECGLDYTVCNFGLYAAVGTSAMLELSGDYIGEGDVVILAVEPTSETFSTYFGATAMLKCAENDLEMLLHLNESQQSNLVGNYLTYLQERSEIQRTGILPQADGVYAKSSFDENGDMRFDRTGNAMLLGYDPANPIDLGGITYEAAFVEQVNDYISAAEANGAAVFMSFSPMNRGALTDSSEETIYRFFTGLQEQFRCPIISDPNDYILDSGWFYDSNYHLNTPGMSVRTHQLTCDLLHHLGYYSLISFEPPGMPKPMVQIDAGNTDSGDFLFEPVGENGFLVSGLSSQGKEKQSLFLPSIHNGKPVVGITNVAFSGNTQITELIFPETILSIPDGAFSGCVNLRKLTLLHTQTPPDVGTGLLEGTEYLVFFVPSGSYHLYQDGAGCEANPWEPYLKRIIAY